MGAHYAFAWIYNKSQMKCVTLFWGIKNIHKTPYSNSDMP